MKNSIKSFLGKEDTIEVLGYIISLRAILLGFSFAFNRPEAVLSVLYKHIEAFPGVEPEVFGWILMVSGFITLIGYVLKKKRFVKTTSQFQFMVYIFAAVVYFLNGSVISGLIAAFVPALLTYFVSSRFYYRKTDDELREEWGLPPRGN